MDVECNLNFTLNLLEDLSLSAASSALFSPISLLFALTMAYSGARGDTRREFHNLFCIKENEDRKFSDQLQQLRAVGDISNFGYLANDFEIDEEFQNQTEQSFGAKWQNVDFTDQKTANLINSAVSEKTNGLISNLIDNIDPSTRMLILNTVLVSGEWDKKFSELDGKFRSVKDRRKPMRMMRKETSRFGYVETDDLEVVRLSFGFGKSFLVFRPKQRFELSKIFKKIDKKLLDGVMQYHSGDTGNMTINLNITIPKFEYEQKFEANQLLKNVSLQRGFDKFEADFSGISKTDNLYISKVFQKATIKVGPERMEAAAATGFMDGKVSGPAIRSKTYIQFHVDSPFLYMIVSDRLDVLFAGVFHGED